MGSLALSLEFISAPSLLVTRRAVASKNIIKSTYASVPVDQVLLERKLRSGSTFPAAIGDRESLLVSLLILLLPRYPNPRSLAALFSTLFM